MGLLKVVSMMLVVFAFQSIVHAAPEPTADLSDVPAVSFAGEEFCFDVSLANTGDVGYGPYLQLQLPAGISFSSSTFLDNPVSTQNVGTFPPDLIDPLTNETVTGTNGNSLIIIQPPIGSIVTGGPDLYINVCADIADDVVIGDQLTITSTPVFQFGDTATGDNGPISGSTETTSVTPSLVDFEKVMSADEGESTPGSSWPVSYQLVADIANGNTISNLEFNDVLPSQLQYVAGSLSVTGGNGCVPSVNGQTIKVDCVNATGTAVDNDVVVSYQAFVTDVLEESACSSDVITNTSSFDAQRYDSVTSTNTAITTITSEETLTTSHVVMQKSVTPGVAPSYVSPGDSLTYTVNLQTSDFGTVNSLVFNDLLPDGLENFNAVSVTGPTGPLTIVPVVTNNTDGTIGVVYDIHAVSGDLPPASEITIVYTADIAQFYTNPNTPVKANDFLTNSALINYGLVEGASNCSDVSSATVSIRPLALTKEILNAQTEYQPGDVVTFRLTMSIPSGDTSNIVFDDFFPLPVFDVSTLNLAFGSDIRLAASDTLGIVPTNISIDSVANKLSINWPDVSTISPQVLAVDIDIKVGTQPFADNLSLSNLFQASTSNTPTPAAIVNLGLAGIKVGAPVLEITKGVVSSTNSNSVIDAATVPVDSNLIAADASDTITYEITVENIGGAPARSIQVADDLGLPANLLENCSVVSVVNGNGTSLAYSVSPTFNGVINLTDQLEQNDGDPIDGGAPYSTDTALIRIACNVSQAVVANQIITNTSSAVWTSDIGEALFPAVTDDATITISAPEIEKTILTSGTTFTIGDIIRYEITYTVPELTLNDVLLHDQLDPGLAFVNVNTHTIDRSADVTSNTSVFNISNNGRTLDLNLGTVVNSNNDNSQIETIKIAYDVVVVNDTNANAGDTLNNTAIITSTNSSSGNTSADDITILEPNIVVDKTVASGVGPYDAGDTVTYDWHIRQEGTNLTTAYDVILIDTLPSNVTYVANSLQQVSGSCSLIVTDDTTLGVLTATALSFTATDDCHYQYQVVLDVAVTAGVSLNNTVDIDWTSQAGTVAGPISIYNADSCERTSATNPECGSGNDYDVEDSATIDIREVVIKKLSESTSETTTTKAEDRTGTIDLSIGETATYSLTITVPEGTSEEIVVTDNFPANAAVVMEFVSVDSVSIGSSLTTANTPVGVVSDARLGDGILDRVVWDFGKVVNSSIDGIDNNDDNDERIIIVVTGRIVDNVKNTSGDRARNISSISFGPGLTDTSLVALDVVEPLLEINKSSTTTTADAADDVTFTLRVNHSSASTQEAFDLIVTDLIPAGLVYVDGSLQQSTLASCSVMATLDDSDPTVVGINARFDNLPKTDVCELTFDAKLDNSVNPNQIITNTANLQWDSLVADDDANERNYSINDDHQITVSSPGVSKVVFETSEVTSDASVNGLEEDVTIGERVTYRFTATIPEGESNSVIITDQLPNTGVVLRKISSRIVSIGSNLGLTASAGDVGDDCSLANACDSNNDGEPDLAEWNLGTIVNTPDGSNDTNDEIVFGVVAVVTDATVNTGTDDDVVNTAVISFGSGQMVSGSVAIDIVEPKLSISKQATPAASPFIVDAGDVVTFEIEVSHDADSNADAFNIQLIDTLANDGSTTVMQWNGDGNIGGTCIGTVVDSSASGAFPFNVIFDVPTLDTATGSCTITYEVLVDTLATPGQTLQNSVALEYDSTPVFVATETRSSTDNATADVIVSAPSMMVKEVTASSLSDTGQSQHGANLQDLAIGEEVTYTISLKFPEGTTKNVILTDVMPSGTDGVIEMAGPPIVTLGNKVSTSLSDVSVNPANDGFTIDFGTVTNLPDNVDTSDDLISVTVTGVVTDNVSNVDGAQPVNSATFSYTDAASTVQNLTDTAIVDIVEPKMLINKTMTVDNGLATITIDLENTGTASAYDIQIEDVLDLANWDTSQIIPTTVPAGFTLTTVSGPNPTETTVLMTTDDSATAPTNSIEPSETISFVFTVPVQPGISTIDNTATNTISTTVPGSSPNERNEPEVAETETLLIPLIELEKTAAAFSDTNSDGEVGGVGDEITYIFNVKNTGGVDLTNIVVVDTNSAVSISGNPISIAVGGSDNSITGTYEITQEDMDLGTITNTATVTADGPTGTGSTSDVSDDPTDADNVDINGDGEPDDPTIVTLPRNPSFNMEKTTVPSSITVPGIITYVFTFTNIGNIDLTNLAVNDPDIDVNSLVCNGDSDSDGAIDNLAIDGVQTCTAERTISQAQINAGTAITNSATASATDLDGISPVSESDTSDNSTSTPIAQSPRYNMVKTASPASISEPGSITYTFTFTNTGNVALTNLTVADDDIDSALVCPNGTQIDLLPVGTATKSCTATRVVTQEQINTGTPLLNTAMPSANGPNGIGLAAEDSTTDNTTETTIAQSPSYNMVKTASPASISTPGNITYTFTFTNTGNVALTNLTVADNDIDSVLDCPNGTQIDLLPVGTTTKSCTSTRAVSQEQINAGTTLTNTATPTAYGPNGTGVVTEDSTADNTAETSITQSPSYNMVKTASPASISSPGNITYTFTFTNTGNVALTNLTVADDDIDSALVCPNGTQIDSLAVGTATKSCTATRAVSQEQINAGTTLTNTATPIAYGPNGSGVVTEDSTADNTAETTVSQSPSYNMVKTASPASISTPGDITYTFTFTNTGNVALTNLTVADDDIDSALVCPNGTQIDSLPVGTATQSCTATRAVSQEQINAGTTLTNTATPIAYGPNGTGVVTEDSTADNTAETSVTQSPSYNMVKTASPASISSPGDITYTFTFTNTGNVALTNLTVADNDIDSVLDCPNGTQIDSLPVGTATQSCTATRAVSQEQINAGTTLTNTATPTAYGPNGTGVVTEDSTADNTAETTVSQSPSYNMVKTASPASISTPGNITYTFTFTNTGNVELTNLTVADDDIDSALVCPNGTQIDSLPVGTATKSCTATRAVSQEQINAGTTLTNTATPTAYGPNGTDVATENSTTDNTAETPVTQSPSYNMVKTANVSEISEPGIITYTFEFTNTGNIDLLDLSISDLDIDAGSLVCEDDDDSNDDETDTDESIPLLIVGTDTKSCTAERIISQDQINSGIDLVNTAVPTANVGYTLPNGDPVVVEEDDDLDNTATTTVDQNAGFNMVKTVSAQNISAPGSLIYTFTFTNTGNVDLTNLTVMDADINPGSLVCEGDLDGDTAVNIDVLEVGATTKACTATRTVTQDQINAGIALTNTATPDVKGPDGITDVNETNIADNSVTTSIVQQPAFDMVKTAEPAEITAPGNITYTFTFTNSGNVLLTNLTVNDLNIDAATLACTDDSDGIAGIDSLGLGATKVCTATREVTQEQINAGSDLTNTATANVKGPNGTIDVVESDLENNSTVTPITQTPAFNMVKTASPEDISEPGVITYEFIFTNNGNVDLTDLVITDINIDTGTLTCSNDANSDAIIDTLPVGTETVSCTALRTVTQDQINAGDALENTATSVATAPDGNGGIISLAETDESDNSTITPVIQNPSYNMIKTAEPEVITEAGEITYTFTFTNTGNVDLANLKVIDENIDADTMICMGDSDFDLDIDELAPNSSVTCTALRTITQAQLATREPIINEATSAAETLNGSEVVEEFNLLDNRVSTPVIYTPTSIPTLSEWMLVLLSMILLLIGYNQQQARVSRRL
ncbi:hypothetical protein GCM10009133_26250 [Cocleimonas flava]|uniref:Putative secreted protein (IPTL-CTERM system target) n=1 Tax=Cocleimonas flava TaxID=634765 RepID=A0A4R1ETS6_9GAMM|nr:isopeptide-forming domain-containing fimbrial protein [Cocleimonas flava]TCJ83159.1 putative secreted protein (IPTL-CTERM system target) [Cocleimonas flava]